MSEKIEALLQQMQELTTVVRDCRLDPATLDAKQVEQLFGAQVDALVEQRVREAIDRKPVYRTPGGAIGAGMDLALLKNNRYGRILKGIDRDGYAQVGTGKVKPIDLWMAHELLSKGHALMPDRVAQPSDDLTAALKAMTSTGSGTGDELVPTNMASELWEDFFLASRVAGLFDTIEMPSNPFDVPLGFGDTTWRKGTENAATSASDLTTAKSTLTATELVTEVNWSYTLQEDSIVAFMPAVRNRLAISGAEVIDAFALNADATATSTGNINLDDQTPAADSYYLSAGQDGLRHLPLADNSAMANSAGGDALADADITGVMAEMGKYAVVPERMAIICDISTYLNGFLKLSDVTTIDKFGAGASILTGQLAAYRGIPIVVSASMPKTENDGKACKTAGSNTLGNVLLVNRNMWVVGFRRNLLVEVDRDIQKRQYILVVSLREAIAAYGTRASATHTGLVYNILV